MKSIFVGVSREESDNVVDFLRGCKLFNEYMYFLSRGILRIKKIILAKPYSRYSWYLVANLTTRRMWREGEEILYHGGNRDRLLWCIAGTVHAIMENTIYAHDPLTSGILSYTLVYGMGLYDLYEGLIERTISSLCRCDNIVPDAYAVASMHIPRIIANRLKDVDYGKVLTHSRYGASSLIELWLSLNPDEDELLAVSNALSLCGYNPIDYDLPEPTCSIQEDIGDDTIVSYARNLLESIDNDYIDMLRVLLNAIKNPDNAWNILSPWWDEIVYIKDLINDLIYYGSRRTSIQ